jgi:hypothetical protein
MSLITHAEKEFEILGWRDGDMQEMVCDNVIELLTAFSGQGHSGSSAPYVLSVFKKLANFEIIAPLKFADDEWNECSDGDYQNSRLSSVFKNGKGGRPYYLEAIVFRGQNGLCFTGSSVALKDGSTISSRQYVKQPFTPKTFYIDVIETEWADRDETVEQEGGGWWTSVVKDESQLDEVFEYYDRYEVMK